ncbi:putative Serine-rich protein-related [Tripterygium wilfordii]|uniref:Putative Serine-rich protein-related n=1 Tax=Tripterygium wilfordii TaxID=458696 RepID=A0A7J7C2V3_TRIWF|nr:uncharacterized protein LOC119988970 [Tripterygium wilfordii]KAF5728484.1 putative Serine-rich protein-related [Tripterygium wilfordii]
MEEKMKPLISVPKISLDLLKKESTMPPISPRSSSIHDGTSNASAAAQQMAAIIKRTTSLQVSPRGGSTKGRSNCLCSPTTHAGSFRCRYHRFSGMHRGGSVGSNLSELAAKQQSIKDLA